MQVLMLRLFLFRLSPRLLVFLASWFPDSPLLHGFVEFHNGRVRRFNEMTGLSFAPFMCPRSANPVYVSTQEVKHDEA